MTETTQHTTQEPGLLAMLGINGSLFLAQLINFLIVMFVVYRWIYRPLLIAMKDRQAKIEAGLREAEAARQALREAEAEKQTVIRQAREEAVMMMDTIRMEAEEKRKALAKETELALEKQLEEARERLQKEKEAVMHAIQKEAAELVALATGKVVSGSMVPEVHDRLIEASIDEIAKSKKDV